MCTSVKTRHTGRVWRWTDISEVVKSNGITSRVSSLFTQPVSSPPSLRHPSPWVSLWVQRWRWVACATSSSGDTRVRGESWTAVTACLCAYMQNQRKTGWGGVLVRHWVKCYGGMVCVWWGLEVKFFPCHFLGKYWCMGISSHYSWMWCTHLFLRYQQSIKCGNLISKKYTHTHSVSLLVHYYDYYWFS